MTMTMKSFTIGFMLSTSVLGLSSQGFSTYQDLEDWQKDLITAGFTTYEEIIAARAPAPQDDLQSWQRDLIKSGVVTESELREQAGLSNTGNVAPAIPQHILDLQELYDQENENVLGDRMYALALQAQYDDRFQNFAVQQPQKSIVAHVDEEDRQEVQALTQRMFQTAAANVGPQDIHALNKGVSVASMNRFISLTDQYLGDTVTANIDFETVVQQINAHAQHTQFAADAGTILGMLRNYSAAHPIEPETGQHTRQLLSRAWSLMAAFDDSVKDTFVYYLAQNKLEAGGCYAGIAGRLYFMYHMTAIKLLGIAS